MHTAVPSEKTLPSDGGKPAGCDLAVAAEGRSAPEAVTCADIECASLKHGGSTGEFYLC